VAAVVEKTRRKSRIKEPSVGCNGSLSRIEINNLRTKLEGVHSGKISLPDAEARLKLFEREQWIVPKIKNDDNDDGEDDELSPKKNRSSTRKKRKASQRKSDFSFDEDEYGDDDREDEMVHLCIGPRTYMELPELLTKMGVLRIPQFILHRSKY